MKLILDLDKETLENMQGYCNQHNIKLSKMLTDLFNNYIQNPAEIIDEIHQSEGNLDNMKHFALLLMDYMNEAIYDIEESASSDERYETDEAMIEVFKVLNRDFLNNPYLLANLYKAFKSKLK